MVRKDYDIEDAFAAIEDELIDSMIRNMKLHRLEEDAEEKQWEMWQALQLKALEEYKKKNQTKFTSWFSNINKRIEEVIKEANVNGYMDQELAILDAIKKGFKGYKKSSSTMQAEFFRLNERKLEALIKATTDDMKKAEVAILRMANDQYRKVIFNAQMYANTGAGTYEKAIDMATRDMLYAGLNCVEYANGARHTLKDYADMALRTASKRAYLQGEGTKRQEWGISTVIINKRGNPCPKCLPFCGKILIDDVWSGGTREDGPYSLMSKAIAAGLYHPRCKDSHTTYFGGISTNPDGKYSKKEIEKIKEDYQVEQKQQYAKRQVEKFERLEKCSLDEDNRELCGYKANMWKQAYFRTGGMEAKEYAFDKTSVAKNFEDVTEKWKQSAKNSESIVVELKEITVKGIRYLIDGTNVKQNNSTRELEIADILKNVLGGKVELVPEISGIYDKIKTPDYLLNGHRYDLKEIKGTSKDAIRNAIHKKREQADNFIIDISQCPLSIEEINRQLETIFSSYNTTFVETLILIKDNNVLRVLQRR